MLVSLELVFRTLTESRLYFRYADAPTSPGSSLCVCPPSAFHAHPTPPPTPCQPPALQMWGRSEQKGEGLVLVLVCGF